MPPIARRGNRAVVAAEHRRYCYTRRLEGHSIRAIAQLATDHFERSISKSQVQRLISEEITDRTAELGEQVRQQEVDRLDRYALLAEEVIKASIVYDPETGEKIAQDAERTSLQALDRLIRISERRAKLLGLDAPTQIQNELSLRYSVDGIDLKQLQ
jgi:predicted Ser/Thr protein kinase